MSSARTIMASKKVTSSHSSVIEAAVTPVLPLLALPCVSKLSLGLIKAIGNGPHSLKVLDEGPGCLLVKVRGSRSIQEVRVYTSDKIAVHVTLGIIP